MVDRWTDGRMYCEGGCALTCSAAWSAAASPAAAPPSSASSVRRRSRSSRSSVSSAARRDAFAAASADSACEGRPAHGSSRKVACWLAQHAGTQRPAAAALANKHSSMHASAHITMRATKAQRAMQARERAPDPCSRPASMPPRPHLQRGKIPSCHSMPFPPAWNNTACHFVPVVMWGDGDVGTNVQDRRPQAVMPLLSVLHRSAQTARACPALRGESRPAARHADRRGVVAMRLTYMHIVAVGVCRSSQAACMAPYQRFRRPEVGRTPSSPTRPTSAGSSAASSSATAPR
eukprot:366510-Chlamydomonas_euryale.AAC.19